MFDATQLEFCCPLDLAGVAAWAAHHAAAGADTSFIVPDTEDPAMYASRMDLYDRLTDAGVDVHGSVRRVRRNVRTESLIEVRAIFNRDDVDEFTDKTFRLVKSRIGPSEARANHSMFGELLENALTHAESAVGAYAAAQVYPTKKRIEISIADAGIGIRAHLQRNPKNKRITTDTAAIEYAAKEGVTGVQSTEPDEQRGRGFTNLLTLGSRYGANLVIRTGAGRGTLVARPNKATNSYVSKTQAAIPGTWASLAVTFRHPAA